MKNNIKFVDIKPFPHGHRKSSHHWITKQGKIKGELQNSAQIKEKIDNNNCKFERIY